MKTERVEKKDTRMSDKAELVVSSCIRATNRLRRATGLDPTGDAKAAEEEYLAVADLLLSARIPGQIADEPKAVLEKIVECCMDRIKKIRTRLPISFQEIRCFHTEAISLLLSLSESGMYGEILMEKLGKVEEMQTDEFIRDVRNLEPQRDTFHAAIPVSYSQLPAHVSPEREGPKSSIARNTNFGISPAKGDLSEREKKILRKTSKICENLFYPWSDKDVDTISMSERKLYRDPNGNLKLSDKQRQHFCKWKRLKQIHPHPRIVKGKLQPSAVTQNLVSDCSFVSSLVAVAEYERRFGRRLITSIIYPQSSSGIPIHNPSGQYMLKLNINGIPRRVDIDDMLPTSSDGRLICSYSREGSEFWVSLLEKAYLKVMGGYNFPGSTSEIDLFTLTGWIPETIHTTEREFGEERAKEKVWVRMKDGHNLGQCLMTMSTKTLSDREEKELGLVSTHAYAVLDVQEVPTYNLRLLKLKNPWSETRWKGRFSCFDSTSWTSDLQNILNYDVEQARRVDNGVFWINWESALKVYSAIHFNWQPNLFEIPHAMHSYWPVPTKDSLTRGPDGGGALSDRIHFGHCPQFRVSLNMSNANDNVSLWIHLSKHILEEPTAPNEDYVAIHVFQPKGEDEGKRVYNRTNYLTEGIYVNNVHRLTRLDVPPQKGQDTITLVVVVSLYERKRDIAFSLRMYAKSAKIECEEIPFQYPHEIEPLISDWSNDAPVLTNANIAFLGVEEKETLFNAVHRSLGLGPLGWKIFAFKTSESSEMMLQIQGPKEVGLNMCLLSERGEKIVFSLVYKPGFVYIRKTVAAGTYILVVVNHEKEGGKRFVICGGVAVGRLQIAAITT